MTICPQCGEKTTRQNPLRKQAYPHEDEKVCAKCGNGNHVTRMLGRGY